MVAALVDEVDEVDELLVSGVLADLVELAPVSEALVVPRLSVR